MNTIAASVYMNVQTVSIDSVSPEISEPNRRMCLLTLSDTYHHHTHSVYIHVYVKGTVESVEIQQRKKRETNTQKKIRKQKYDN